MHLRTLAAALALMPISAPAMAEDDPHVWLEEWSTPRAMKWVEEHNAQTDKRLTASPHYTPLRDEALAILGAKDRIPTPSLTGDLVTNFWQDGQHLRGIWRKTSQEDYGNAEPKWQVLLDIDALGKAEGKSYVWKGANCLGRNETPCMVGLSIGGEDATESREFDVITGQFVKNGFLIPKSIQSNAWIDGKSMLVATDWSGKDLTKSGYPFIVKRLARGQSIDQAKEVFRGQVGDTGVFVSTLQDGAGHSLQLITRALDFYHSEQHLLTSRGTVKIGIPAKSSIRAMVGGRVVIGLDEDWKLGGTVFPAGSLVWVDQAAMLKDPANLKPQLLWAPGKREALEGVTATRDRLVVSTLDNVRGRITAFAPMPGGKWQATPLALPDNMALDVVTTNLTGNSLFLNVSGFLTPTTLYRADAVTGAVAAVKSLPARFDASKHVVQQFEATSTDGTKVPYFIVHRKDMPLDGSTPTLLNAYGGFQVSETPFYSGTLGKQWFERGGAYVLANIRGGGEFGPAWHEAALKTKRQVAYDDFAAVAKDLIARKVTSPRRLGAFGGSNGGLLMGVAMTQTPELFNAISIEIPLLDMLRIGKIARGASWQGEYGDPETDPAVRAFWEKVSPYHALKPGVTYPEPYVFTTTRDDRVGPQHARKFAAKLEDMKLPYYFYENTEGGHGSGADIKQQAHTSALRMTYFVSKLMD